MKKQARLKTYDEFYRFLTEDYRGKTTKRPLTHRAALDACSLCLGIQNEIGISIDDLVPNEYGLQSTLELAEGRLNRNRVRALRLYYLFLNRSR
jgi:hypothetical protein